MPAPAPWSDPRTWLGAAVLAILTVLTWWVWLGQDTTYQIDPDTGRASGPYEAPQVVGCALTLVVLCAIAAWLLPRVLVVVVMTAAFTVAWSLPAAAQDTTGLWAVGAMGVLFGMSMGSTVVVSIVAGLRENHVRGRLRRPGP